MGQSSWRTPQNMPDWMGSVEKRLNSLDARPTPMSAADLLGPGAASQAIQISDWSGDIATFNGNFYTEPGALHSPDPEISWTGSVIAKNNGSGMQQAWNTDDLDNVRYYMRTYAADGPSAKTFSEWRHFATPSGYVEFENLDPAYTGDIQAQLDAAAEAIGFILPPLQVYRQATPPSDPDSLSRDLQVGDEWLDTDDGNHPYLWDGDDWVDYASYVLGDIPAQLSAAQAAAEAAADSAADAMDFAVSRNRTFRGASAPTNPSGGYPLTVNDVWFENDDLENMWVWNGSAWVDLGIENTTDSQAKATAAQAAAILAAASDATTKAGNAQSAAISTAAGDATTKAANALTSANTYTDNTVSVLTATTFQTSATAARGIKINSGGLVAYTDGSIPGGPAAGTAMFVISAATGAITMRGDLTSGSTVTGAVVTGGTVQSEATASRGVKITSGGLTAYNTSGVVKLTIDASTGALTSDGPVFTAAGISGSTVTGGTVQSEVTAARGVKLTSGGLIGYDGAGVTKFSLGASTGILTLAGGVFSASDVSGSTVTGGTVQSEATASRGIKLNSSGLTAYDGSGTATFTIVASTGAITAVGGVLSGGSVTGALLQTTATAARGVKIATGGLTAYNSSGAATFTIDASTGAVVMLGSLTSGSTIDGAVVTGGTFQTQATAARGIKINSSGFVAYNSSGVAQVTIDATTGSMILAGTMTGGGTITGPAIQTAATGQRIVMRDDGSAGIIEGYSGISGELPARINPQNQSGTPVLFIQSGTTPARMYSTSILMYPGTSAGLGQVTVAGSTLFYHNMSLSSDLAVSGHITVTGTGWIRAGAVGGPVWGTNWTDYDATVGSYELACAKRVGNKVTVHANAKRTSGAATTIMTLPLGMRPSRVLAGKVCRINNTAVGTVGVSTGGAVGIEIGTYVNGELLAFEFEFDLDQP